MDSAALPSGPSAPTVATSQQEIPAVFGVEVLASLLGITEGGARAVIRRGEVPAARLGRRFYIRREDFIDLFRSQRAETLTQRDKAVRILRGLS